MSLLSRVSSVEQLFPDERNRSSSPPRHRKLSFSPLPGAWDEPEHGHCGHEHEGLEPIGAFEVGKTKRLFQVGTAVIYCLFAAGVVFGYAALKPVLIKEHVYRNLCTHDELDRDVRVCFAQEIRLNLMFTSAAVGTNVAALPIGAILDNFGPRICGLIGSILLAIGALLFSFAWQLDFDAYIPGYLFMALGGPFVFISSFQLSNTFPKHSGLILALLTGAFDASSALFLVYRLIYDASTGTFKPSSFFLLYLIVPALIFLMQILLMPHQSYKTVGELLTDVEEDSLPDDQVSEHTALLRDEARQRHDSLVHEINDLLGSKSGGKQKKAEEHASAVSGVWGVLHGYTIVHQILSPWFVLITLFTVIQMTRINYFVATILPQYEYLLGSYDAAVEVNKFFDIALPLGGLLSIPFIGTILDRTSTAAVLSLLVTLATTIGVLGTLPYKWAAYANICLFVMYRPFYYTAVSDYSAKVFGFRTFGTVYGFIICLAGLGNFSQTALDTLTLKVFNGSPVPVNVGLMTIAVVVGVALAAFVGFQARSLKRKRLEVEAEDAAETAMPGASYSRSNGHGHPPDRHLEHHIAAIGE